MLKGGEGIIKLVFNGEPIPALRPRISGNRMYDLPKVRNYKKLIAWESKMQYKGKPLKSELVVEMIFYRPIQKSGTIQDKKDKRSGKIRPTVKPDISNYIKIVEDGMNGIIYKDDSQIVEITGKKFYSDSPKVEVFISELHKNEK